MLCLASIHRLIEVEPRPHQPRSRIGAFRLDDVASVDCRYVMAARSGSIRSYSTASSLSAAINAALESYTVQVETAVH